MEDAQLRAAVAEEGDCNWKRVAMHVPHRSPDDCLQRWRYSICPAIKRGRWTPEEDDKLREAVAVHGACKWQVVAVANKLFIHQRICA